MTLGSAENPLYILLVAAEPKDARMTQEVIRESGVEATVEVAEDGEAALCYLRKEAEHTDASRPHLILLDLNLPKKSGIEVLTEINADADLGTIPVFVLTGTEAEAGLMEGYNIHPSRLFKKPIDSGRFNNQIQNMRSASSFAPIGAGSQQAEGLSEILESMEESGLMSFAQAVGSGFRRYPLRAFKRVWKDVFPPVDPIPSRQIPDQIESAPEDERSPAPELEESKLDEACEPEVFVSTDASDLLTNLLRRRSITIGLAGPRGTGKSTIVKRVFDRQREEFEDRRSTGRFPYYPLYLLVGWALADVQYRALVDLLRKASAFLITCPLTLPILGDLISMLSSRNISRKPGLGFTRSNRGPVAVEPISTPTRYDEKQFLHSLFEVELKAVEQTLRNEVLYLGHRPFFSLRHKILVIGVTTGLLAALGFYEDTVLRLTLLTPETAWLTLQTLVAFLALIWMWDNLHRVWPLLRYRYEQRLLSIVLARLQRLSFDQTYTSFSTAEMAPVPGLRVAASSGVELVRQPYTRVSLVEDMKEFAEDVLTVFDKLYVGIDELDKMHETEDVRRFLRGIKGIFSIEPVCYVLTVSNEAVETFDLRNLSGRDELDSSFREIVKVESLDVDKCSEVLEKRDKSLTPPERHMLAILSGGNTRELLRRASDYLWFVRQPPTSCECDSSARGYFEHVAHIEVENLIDSIRGLAFPDGSKHEVIIRLQALADDILDFSPGNDGAISAKVAKVQEKIRQLPSRDLAFHDGVSTLRHPDDGTGSEMASDQRGLRPIDRGVTTSERLQAAVLRTVMRLGIWSVLSGGSNQAILRSSASAEQWRNLATLATVSPFEAQQRMKDIVLLEPVAPGMPN